MRMLGVICITLSVGACATSRSESGAVTFTGNAEVVKGCQFIEQATGRQYLIGGILLMGAAKEDADRQLRERALEVGGTHVVTQSSQMGMGGAYSTGDIYRCGPK